LEAGDERKAIASHAPRNQLAYTAVMYMFFEARKRRFGTEVLV
jgi:hypothetical protein